MSSKILSGKKNPLLAFTLFYVLAVILCVYPANYPFLPFVSQKEMALEQPDSKNCNLVYQIATTVNASGFYLLSARGLLLQTAGWVLLLPGLWLTFQYFTFFSRFFNFRDRFLFRILPNGP